MVSSLHEEVFSWEAGVLHSQIASCAYFSVSSHSDLPSALEEALMWSASGEAHPLFMRLLLQVRAPPSHANSAGPGETGKKSWNFPD